jgi:hypothetical protein
MIGAIFLRVVGSRTRGQRNAAWAGALLVPFGVLAQAGPILRRGTHGWRFWLADAPCWG